MGQDRHHGTRQHRQQPGQRGQASFLGKLWKGYWQRYKRQYSVAGRQRATHAITPRVISLVLSIVLCSALDALWTLLHLERGLREANPFMAQTLAYGPTFFTALKMTLTGAGVLILAVHQHFALAWQGLHVMGFAYALLLGYHLVLFRMTP